MDTTNLNVQVPIGKLQFFKNLMNNLGYNYEEDTSKELILADLKEAIEEVKLAKQGKIELKSAYDLLDEL